MKWVTALNLEQWAPRIGSRTQLSELVSRLVRATAKDIQSFRFPTGDSAQLPGYDGRLTAIGDPPYVPDGESVWEFGNDADYVQKANDDFDARTKNPGNAVPAQTTFVFVTARRWTRTKPSLDDWVNDRKNEAWKDVRVVDAIALESWLEDEPAVGKWAARYLLNLVTESGARSTDEFWEEYSARFKPQLTEKVLLCDREEQSKTLLARLQGGPQDVPIQADSPDEVVAFAIAMIRDSEPEIRKWLEARTLVLDTEEAGRQLSRHQNMVYIPRAAALSVSGLLATYNPTIVPLGRDRPNTNVTILNRPTTRALSAALETMSFKSDDAYQLARASGRSVTILRRRIPNGDAGKPEWADRIDLIPALLCGGWESTRDADKEILRALIGDTQYGGYEANLQLFLKMHDPPIDREGEVWKIRAPVDAFVHLGSLVSGKDLENLRTVAIDVFSEIDPSLDRPEGDPTFLSPRDKMRHSEWLRDGLATTLLQIAVLHAEAGLVTPGTTAQAYVDELVANLPGLSGDYRLMASLRDQLPLLAEAAPRPFLAALDKLLEGDGDALRPLFRSGELFSPTSPHTYVLWALEPLAWDPDYLSRVALILIKLARIDPGGQTVNRPINTLKEILLTWNPHTNATLEHRLAVLDQIIEKEAEVGWKLISLLLPQGSGTSFPNSRPRYREAGASERETLTWRIVFEAQRHVVRRALGMLDADLGRWQTVLRAMQNFEPASRDETINLLQRTIDTSDESWKHGIWEILHHEVNKHRSFPTADWSLKGQELQKLEAIVRSLTPNDPLERHGWLFDSDYPDVPIEDFARRIEAIANARKSAVTEIRGSLGDEGLISLADRVRFPGLVGLSAVDEITDPEIVDTLIDSSLGKTDRLNTFARALSSRAQQRFSGEWPGRITARAKSGRWTPNQIALLLESFDDVPETWDLAASLGAEVDEAYWKGKHSWWLKSGPDASERAARKYLSVGRAAAALEAIHEDVEQIPAALIFELLDRTLEEMNPSQEPPSGLFTHNIEELFKRLAERGDVPPVELAKREYAYLPLFGFEPPQLTLHRLLAEEPSLYVQILCDVFRPASGVVEEPTSEQRAKAQVGYHLLSSFHVVPGTSNGAIDSEKLKSWTSGVRDLANKADRGRIADQYVGHILAHGPSDPTDGAWPHRVIRDLLETLASDDVEAGIRTERFNMRGVVSKEMFEGGRKERELAEQARNWAKTAIAYARASAMLSSIANEWDAYADQEDLRARQDQLKYG